MIRVKHLLEMVSINFYLGLGLSLYYVLFSLTKQILAANSSEWKFFHWLVTHSFSDSFTLYTHKLDTSNVTSNSWLVCKLMERSSLWSKQKHYWYMKLYIRLSDWLCWNYSMACNNFGVIIFNMEDFANKDIRVKRRGLTNFIALYGYL